MNDVNVGTRQECEGSEDLLGDVANEREGHNEFVAHDRLTQAHGQHFKHDALMIAVNEVTSHAD
jgi:hypothetical protein